MANAEKQDRGQLRVDGEECKGCGLCVEACPPKLIAVGEKLNRYGYRTAISCGRGLPGLWNLLCGLPGAGRDHGFAAGEERYCRCGGKRMRKQLMKGNEAIVRSAILAGCRAFYGYPITPASEIAEDAALYMPQAGGVFCRRRARWRR